MRLVLLGVGLLGAQQAVAAVRGGPCSEASPASPADVRFELSLGGGSAFQEGETIPLQLSLSSSAPGRYSADIRGYEGNGRLADEVFCLEPDARDPLAEYFERGVVGSVLSSGPRALGREPIVFGRDLNEWKAVPPGRYRLRAMRDVERLPEHGEPHGVAVRVRVWSNTVELQVVPAAVAWRQAQLADAVREVASADPAVAIHGARALRFLGTKEATRELVRRYTGEEGQPSAVELEFGIIGSVHRELALSLLRSALQDPRRPATPNLVQLLALLEARPDRRAAEAAQSRGGREPTPDEARAAFEADVARVERYRQEALATLESKTPEARARSLDLLLEAAAKDVGTRAQARRLVSESWDRLPPVQQGVLLELRWAEVGGSELLPVLRRMADASGAGPAAPGAVPRDLVLSRLYQLAPAEGRQRIVREILEGRRDLGRLVGVLPDAELPDIEDPVLSRIEAGRGQDADYQLLDRYASAAALPRIRALTDFNLGRWPCAAQSAMLRYLVRVDPATAAARVEQALLRRSVTHCYQWLLPELGAAVAAPEIERIAVRALDDPAPEVATSAAQALRQYGSAAAERPLWARLERFHEQWKDAPDAFVRRPGSDDAMEREAMLELRLAEAIALGHAWYAGPDELGRLRELVSAGRQTEVDAWVAEARQDALSLILHFRQGRELPYYTLGPFSGSGLAAVKQKVAQLPAGTRLLVTVLPDGELPVAALEEIEAAARAAGLEMVKQ